MTEFLSETTAGVATAYLDPISWLAGIQLLGGGAGWLWMRLRRSLGGREKPSSVGNDVVVRHVTFGVALNQLSRKADRPRLVVILEGARDWPYLEPVLASLRRAEQLDLWCVSADRAPPGLVELNVPVRVLDQCRGVEWRAILSRLNADLTLTTLTDLGTPQFPKSGGARYGYVFHSLVSTHVAYAPASFDAYDLIFAPGPVHSAELQARAAAAGLKGRTILEAGYPFLDRACADAPKNVGEPLPRTALIAPSWCSDDLYPSLWTEAAQQLLQAGWTVILRPHPETLKRSRRLLAPVCQRLSDWPKFQLDESASDGLRFQSAVIMVSDWSGAAIEFAAAGLGPVLFFETARKVRNPDWQDLSTSSIEDWSRQSLGIVVAPAQISALPQLVDEALAQGDWSIPDLDWLANRGQAGGVIAAELDALLFAEERA